MKIFRFRVDETANFKHSILHFKKYNTYQLDIPYDSSFDYFILDGKFEWVSFLGIR